jgi:hypothetical protein
MSTDLIETVVAVAGEPAVAVQGAPETAALHPVRGKQLLEQRLSFTVRIVRTEGDLRRAVQVRHDAYARHSHPLAPQLEEPELYDHERGTVVLLAEAKSDGRALGTMRIQTNVFRPLTLEQSVELPAALRRSRLVTANRLATCGGRRAEGVKVILFKALHEFCVRAGIDWAVVAAHPPLDRQYEALLFEDLFPGRELIPLRQAADVPHRILAAKVAAAERLWREHKHPLYSLFFETRCPDPAYSQASPAKRGSEPRSNENSPRRR